MPYWSTLTPPPPGTTVTRCSDFAPLEIQITSHDEHGNLWAQLSDGTQARAETLERYPQPGDKVVIYFPQFVANLNSKRRQAIDTADLKLMQTLGDYEKALSQPTSWLWMHHTLESVEDGKAVIERGGKRRSLPLDCLRIYEAKS